MRPSEPTTNDTVACVLVLNARSSVRNQSGMYADVGRLSTWLEKPIHAGMLAPRGWLTGSVPARTTWSRHRVNTSLVPCRTHWSVITPAAQTGLATTCPVRSVAQS
ncbi:hypothetical protein ACFQV2_33875 [Actinokineospora soli]|uniref:Uncharacterized protein n=1 Tax=Actinokineospora soli TaxID=1048753 RepID=A0ABW2TW13_9PSEU